MFRFVLIVAFLRRVFQVRLMRIAIVLILFVAMLSGLAYAVLVFQSLNERTHASHVHVHATH